MLQAGFVSISWLGRVRCPRCRSRRRKKLGLREATDGVHEVYFCLDCENQFFELRA
jgi:DNA-directed RNA polymerase subunit RPC12/RpoP